MRVGKIGRFDASCKAAKRMMILSKISFGNAAMIDDSSGSTV